MRAIVGLAFMLWTNAALAADFAALTVRQGDADAPLSALTGDAPRMLHLWATWCGPCRVELPRLAETMANHEALGEGIILISVDTAPAERVAEFMAELGVETPYWQVVEGNAGQTLGVLGYPTTVTVVDGAIVEHHTGVMDWSDPAVIDAVEATLSQ